MNPKRVLAIIAMCLFCGAAEASFGVISLERMVERNPVVVIGKIVGVEGNGLLGRRHPGWYLATIRINKVLKNEGAEPSVISGGTVFLAMPDHNESIDASLRHKRGESGVWMLTPNNPGRGIEKTYCRMSHPRQLQPIDAEEKIVAIIARQKDEQAAAIAIFREDMKRHEANLSAMPPYTLKQFEQDLAKTPEDGVDVDQLVYGAVSNRRGTVGYVFLDRTGEVHLATKYFVQGPFREGLAPVATAVTKNGLLGRYRHMDRTGKIVSEPINHELSKSSEGLPVADMADISNSYVAIADDNTRLWGFADQNGKVMISPRFISVGEFREGLVPVVADITKVEREWGYAGTSGEVVIAPAFRYANSFSEGLAVVQILAWVTNPHNPGGIVREPKYGYIDHTGAFAIPAWFDHADPFHNGLARVDEAGIRGFIDKSGKYIWRAAGYHVATE